MGSIFIVSMFSGYQQDIWQVLSNISKNMLSGNLNREKNRLRFKKLIGLGCGYKLDSGPLVHYLLMVNFSF